MTQVTCNKLEEAKAFYGNRLESICKELYSYGITHKMLAQELNLAKEVVFQILPESQYPLKNPNSINIKDIRDTLRIIEREVNERIMLEAEKDRFLVYASIEAKTLSLMGRLVDYYSDPKNYTPGELDKDKYVLGLTTTYLNATKNLRTEVSERLQEIQERERLQRQLANDNLYKSYIDVRFVSVDKDMADE